MHTAIHVGVSVFRAQNGKSEVVHIHSLQRHEVFLTLKDLVCNCLFLFNWTVFALLLVL